MQSELNPSWANPNLNLIHAQWHPTFKPYWILARTIVFMQLPQNERDGLVGYAPITEELKSQVLDFEVLGEVVAHLLKNRAPVTYQSSLQAPDLDEKIKVNGLGSYWSVALVNASFQDHAVTEYFSRNSDWSRQDLREVMVGYYKQALDEVNAQVESEMPGQKDAVFWQILGKSTPRKPSWTAEQQSQIQGAVFVIIAFYFASCDIGEPPTQI